MNLVPGTAALLTKAVAVDIDAARANSLADAAPFIDITDVRRNTAATEELAAAVPNADCDPDPGDDADDD